MNLVQLHLIFETTKYSQVEKIYELFQMVNILLGFGTKCAFENWDLSRVVYSISALGAKETGRNG
jgi:hypothetical protein